MATFGEFSKRFRKKGKEIVTNVNKAVVKAAMVANQTIVLATPVDTGHARANWVVSLGSGSDTELATDDRSGASTISRNNAALQRRKPQQDIFISNNVRYIIYLNEGWSAQAPPNYVEQAVGEAFKYLKTVKVTVNGSGKN